jgi:hypothetical protein
MVARVAHARSLLEGVRFFGEIPGQKGLILVDVRSRILMTMVSMAVDG